MENSLCCAAAEGPASLHQNLLATLLGYATAWSQTLLSPGCLALGYPQLLAQSPAHVETSRVHPQRGNAASSTPGRLLCSMPGGGGCSWAARPFSPFPSCHQSSLTVFSCGLSHVLLTGKKKKKEKKKEKCCNNNNDDNNNNNSRCLHRWVSCAEQRTRGRPYLSLWRCASSF